MAKFDYTWTFSTEGEQWIVTVVLVTSGKVVVTSKPNATAQKAFDDAAAQFRLLFASSSAVSEPKPSVAPVAGAAAPTPASPKESLMTYAHRIIACGLLESTDRGRLPGRYNLSEVEKVLGENNITWAKRVDTAGSVVFFDESKNPVALYTKERGSLVLYRETKTKISNVSSGLRG